MTQKLLSAQCRHTPIPSDPDQATFSSFARHTHPMANHSHLTPETPQLPSLLISTTPLRSLGSVLNRYIHAEGTYFVMRVTHLKFLNEAFIARVEIFHFFILSIITSCRPITNKHLSTIVILLAPIFFYFFLFLNLSAGVHFIQS